MEGGIVTFCCHDASLFLTFKSGYQRPLLLSNRESVGMSFVIHLVKQRGRVVAGFIPNGRSFDFSRGLEGLKEKWGADAPLLP
jgi:hypothetical protein